MNYKKIDKLLRHGTEEDLLLCKEFLKDMSYYEAKYIFGFCARAAHDPDIFFSYPGSINSEKFYTHRIIDFGFFGIGFIEPTCLLLIKKQDIDSWKNL